jgi:hypothetical protein
MNGGLIIWCSPTQADRTFETSSVLKQGTIDVYALDFDINSLEPFTTRKNDRVRTEKRSLGSALANLRRIPPASRLTVNNTVIIILYSCFAANLHQTATAISLHLPGSHVIHIK